MEQHVELVRPEVHGSGSEQGVGLASVHREVVSLDAHEVPLQAPSGQRQRGLTSTGQRDLRSGWEVGDDGRQGGHGGRRADDVGVVEHQDEGAFSPGHDGAQLARAFAERLGHAHRMDQVRSQAGGIVVGVLERQPGERPVVGRRPQLEQRRLPKPRPRHHQHNPRLGRAAQALDQRRPSDQPTSRRSRTQHRLTLGSDRARAEGAEEFRSTKV